MYLEGREDEQSGKVREVGGARSRRAQTIPPVSTQHAPESGFILQAGREFGNRPVKKVVTVEMKRMNSFKGFIGGLIDKAC